MKKDFLFSVNSCVTLDVPDGIDDEDVFFDYINTDDGNFWINEKIHEALKEGNIEIYHIEEIDDDTGWTIPLNT